MFNHQARAAAIFAAGSLLAANLAIAADQKQPKQEVPASTIITIQPKGKAQENVTQQDLRLKVNGRETPITGFSPLSNQKNPVELVLLIDNGARTSLGTQWGDITKFVESQPPETKIAIAYMIGGDAVFEAPLTANRAAVLRTLHLPEHGGAAISASPYFCLDDLTKNWPSSDPNARRVVVMISDGIDYYQVRYDPEDPYVLNAINDSVRAHILIYAIYWRSTDLLDSTTYGAYDGQNLLAELTEATGGESFWIGVGDAVTFAPYFKDINERLANQYKVNFMTAVGNKPELQGIRLQVRGRVKLSAPKQVYALPGMN